MLARRILRLPECWLNVGVPVRYGVSLTLDGAINPQFLRLGVSMQYLKAAVGASGSVSPVFAQPSQWNQLNRFLILGNDTATYYAGVRKLVPENAKVVRRCLADDGPQTVRAITDMRTSGRAPRSDAALLALAMAASPAHAGPGTNAAAMDALPAVARSASELRKFVDFVTAGRGWGRSLRSAIARWYMEKPARQLAMQMIKERRRGRWSHADLLRMSIPSPKPGPTPCCFAGWWTAAHCAVRRRICSKAN